MLRRKNRLLLLGMAVLVLLSGCGGTTGSVDEIIDESIVVSEDAGTSNEASVETQENQESEEQTQEEQPQLSEEERYWQEVLAQFADSDYDLTRALTDTALKDMCADYFTLGVGINGSTLENQTLNLPEYMAVSEKHFNSVTMTNLMKSCYILDQNGSKDSLKDGDGSPVLSFDSIDPTLQWCMDHGMKMRGHTLVWHAQAPEWFFREGYDEKGAYVDKKTMLFRMESYIKQLLTHVQDNYPGVVYCWDVVNEAVDPDKGDKDSFFRCRTENEGVTNPWYATIGEDYVEMAFTYAREYADPEVKLFYNDFNTYMIPKTNAIYALCESLKEKGLIDGIGMQGYWGISYPSIASIEAAIKKFATLDLEIHITELSIPVDEETDEEFEKQGKAYLQTFLMLHNMDTAGGGEANITNVTVFGLKDHYRKEDTTNARFFDAEYQPKPAYEKVQKIFETMYMKKD